MLFVLTTTDYPIWILDEFMPGLDNGYSVFCIMYNEICRFTRPSTGNFLISNIQLLSVT